MEITSFILQNIYFYVHSAAIWCMLYTKRVFSAIPLTTPVTVFSNQNTPGVFTIRNTFSGVFKSKHFSGVLKSKHFLGVFESKHFSGCFEIKTPCGCF